MNHPAANKTSIASANPTHIEVRGARVHNLRNVNVDIPLGQLVGMCGVSGSGKSSLALGVLYAEGSRRYLEALSTYTRRRMGQAARADVDEVRYVPAALALHQRPNVPGVRSTFGTMSELLNSLRLLFSRVGSHPCPRCGAFAPPSVSVAAEQPITCATCGKAFFGPNAEDLAFNSGGACPTCGGTGTVRRVNEAALVPDESKTINEGAVLPWGSLMWDLMKQVCGEMGVRLDVPFSQLTPEERDIVFHGPAEKKHILYKAKKGDNFAELDFTYYNAVYTVENALAKAKDEKGLARVARFLTEGPCPDCEGTRLSAAARGPLVRGINLAKACEMTLDEAVNWVDGVPESLAEDLRPMAVSICESFQHTARRLLELGLGYLSLDRAGSTLSTGERQRVQLARAVRNRTTGVLSVIGRYLPDSKTKGVANAPAGEATTPNASAASTGASACVAEAPEAAPLSAPAADPMANVRPRCPEGQLFEHGTIHLETSPLHTVHALSVDLPVNRLTAVTGVSGSGKTTLVLEELIPALNSANAGETLPASVRGIDPAGIVRAQLIDATPIGANVRSTVATYCGVLDDLRRAFARTDEAKAAGLRAGAFSYNTGKLRCPTCDGTGQVSLDVQFLPDVDVPCPDCRGRRYSDDADAITWNGHTLAQLMAMSIDEALDACASLKKAHAMLQTLHDLGLGYLTLGEATPALSGGEAQRLKLASEMGKAQDGALFVFDEPTIGLHPRDVRTLLNVFQHLVEQGATVVVIEHDLDFIRNADYVVDMGPGGGQAGGRVVAHGTPAQIAQNPASLTGSYL